MDNRSLKMRIEMFEGNIRIMKNEISRVRMEMAGLTAEVEDNKKKVAQHKQLPYLVANVIEVRFILLLSCISFTFFIHG